MTDNNVLNLPLIIAFLFFVGSMLGWVIEFFYRNLISHSGPRGKYFINPGFCHGPYLPIYGVGLSVMFLISYFVTTRLSDASAVPVIIVIGITMTVIELIGGIFLLKVLNMRLWDYRKNKGNFMGLICPLFTCIWSGLGAAYYLLVHPLAIDWLIWLSYNLPFSFFIGFFYGIFLIDIFNSAWKAKVVKEFGDNNEVIIKYEKLKEELIKRQLENSSKSRFFNQTEQAYNLYSALNGAPDALEPKAAKK